jgi:TonB family protein
MRYLMPLLIVLLMASTTNGQSSTAPLSPAEAKVDYVKTIQQHVDQHWSYKKTLDNQFYSVQVTIILNKDGSILDRTIDKISPDKEFNVSAVKQLAQMEPFPAIPEELQLEEYEIRFHLMPNAH